MRFPLEPDDRVLILTLTNLEILHAISNQLPDGLLVGIGSPDEVYEARRALANAENVMFNVATPDEIPWRDCYFTVIIGPAIQPTAELQRVLAPGGRILTSVN